MIPRAGPIVLAALATGAVVALAKRMRRRLTGRHAPGGLLIADRAGYNIHSKLLFGSLFTGIAADIAAVAPSAARLLELAAGPGHLSIRLARDHTPACDRSRPRSRDDRAGLCERRALNHG